MASTRPVKIAVLDTDIPVPAVRSVRGLYSDIFADLLHSAAKKSPTLDSTALSFDSYDVVTGQYPSNLDQIDGILITGSSASAYDQQAWVMRLNAFIREVYTEHPHIRFFGSCFGHQIICQALLAPHGVHVTKDPKGWELGVHSVKLTPAFIKAVGSPSTTSPEPNELRFQFVHADHVVVPPDSLPPGWLVVGASGHCTVQGLLQPGRVLTYQGHFEFDRFINSETLKVFGAAWGDEVRAAALASVDADDDAEAAAEIVARFLLGGLAVEALREKTGLLTPPWEAGVC